MSLIAQLARLCIEFPTEEKTVVVPSLAVGRQLGDRLARVHPWINLRFETVRNLVDGVVGFDLAEQGFSMLSRAQALALVEQACLETLKPDSYFGAIADRPGLHRAIQKTLDDLRHASVAPAAFADHFEDRRKGEELEAILSRYMSLLYEHRFVDRSAALHAAIDLLRATPLAPKRPPLAVLDTVELSAAEALLLRRIGGGDYMTLTTGGALPAAGSAFFHAVCEESEIREVLRRIVAGGIPLDDAELVYTVSADYLPLVHELTADAGIACAFVEGTPAPMTRAGQAALGFLRWAGSDFDAAILRRLCMSGALMWSAQAPACALPRRKPQLPLSDSSDAAETAEASLRRGEAQATLAHSTFTPSQLGRILGDAATCSKGVSPLPPLPVSQGETPWLHGASSPEEGHSTFTPSQLGRVLRDSAIGWGRERYARCIAALRARLFSKLAHDEGTEHESRARERIARTAAAELVVADWLALVPVPDSSDHIDLGELARAAKTFVERHARASSEYDNRAKLALAQMFEELATLPPSRDTLTASAKRLADAVTALLVGPDNARPGALLASPLALGGYSGRRHVFFVGLDDTRIPGAGLQDPVLLDAERVKINESIEPRRLLLYGDASTRKVELFHRSVSLAASAVPEARLTFSYASRDLLEQREQFPAAVMLDAFRAARANQSLGYDDMRLETAKSEASFIPRDGALDLDEWWLGQVGRAGAAAVAETLREECPWLARGEVAMAARDSDAITAFDGAIGDGRSIDPRVTGKAMSPTELEDLAKCPFAWYLKRVLKIEPFEEETRDPAVWLDALQLGNLVHGILEKFVRGVIESGEAISKARHATRLAAMAETEVAAMREEVPPASETSFDATLRDVLRGCELFLDAESRRGSVTPLAVEAAFGTQSRAASPIDLEGPVEIALGRSGTLRVKGRIDRVDRGPDGVEVWDYKSGSAYGYGGRGVLFKGTKLQHALYARAVGEMLRRSGETKPRVAKSGYWFPMEKGGGRMIAKPAPADGELEKVLGHMLDLVADGLLPHGSEEACHFCQYERICGGAAGAAEQWARKAEANPTRKAVKAWAKLQEVK